MAFSASRAESEEEKFLSLPPAEIDARAKDYDDFFRIIHWPSRLPSTILKVYLSHPITDQPKRGFIEVKIRLPDGTIDGPGKFFARSRALTEEEVQKLWELFVSEEIFSLPPEQQSYGVIPRYGFEKGPEHYFFVHVDNRNHRKDEVIRRVLESQPAQRVVTGVAEIVTDFITQIEKESGWADFRAGKEKQ